MGKHQHPGWTNRVMLDPIQSRLQGGEYVDACARVLRDVLVHSWVDDPLGTLWHPEASFRMWLDVEGKRPDHTTFLVGHMDAVHRPQGVPAEVLDHEHTEECEHVLVPFVTGHVCDACTNQYVGFRLCPIRCVATAYAVALFLGDQG